MNLANKQYIDRLERFLLAIPSLGFALITLTPPCWGVNKSDNWTTKITVDNRYTIYFGSATATDTVAGTDATWTTTETWNATGRPTTDYVYVATASDQSTAQGLLAEFSNTTQGYTFLTGALEWQVFPAGRYAATNPYFPGQWPASTMPTQAQVDTAIAYATANGLWAAPSSATGYTNGAAPWGTRPGISSIAQWIWFESGNVPGGTYPSPFEGGNHDEFLVFRVQPIPNDCPTNEVILNTGYDHLDGGVLSVGAIDPRWRVVQDPTSNTTEPRPAQVITKNAAWATPDVASQWISGYPSSVQNLNGSYVFETVFCVRPGVDLCQATLQIGMRADDQSFASLNGGTEFHTGDAFTDPSLTISTYPLCSIGGVVGPNRLRVRVQNVFSVAMGLDLIGKVIASPNGTTDRPECCANTGAVQGRVFRDTYLNGVWEVGEPGLQGWLVSMQSVSNPNIVFQSTTDGSGFYNFTDVPPDTYSITESVLPYWVQVSPPGGAHIVTLTGIQGINNLDFGNRRDRRWKFWSWPLPPPTL